MAYPDNFYFIAKVGWSSVKLKSIRERMWNIKCFCVKILGLKCKIYVLELKT